MQEIFCDINKITFHIVYKFNDRYTKSLFILPGFGKSNQSIYTKLLYSILPTNINIFYINHRGHSKSTGIFYFGKYEVDEIENLIIYLIKKFQLNEKNYFMGFSIGGNIFYNIAKKTELIDNLLIISPPYNWYNIYPKNLFKVIRYFKFYKERFVFPKFIPYPFKTYETSKKINNLKLIHNSTDWLISYKHIQHYKKQNKNINLVIYTIKYPIHAEEILYDKYFEIKNEIYLFLY